MFFKKDIKTFFTYTKEEAEEFFREAPLGYIGTVFSIWTVSLFFIFLIWALLIHPITLSIEKANANKSVNTSTRIYKNKPLIINDNHGTISIYNK